MNESSEEFDYSKIKAELETLREKLEALETKQATFKTSTHPTVRRRFAKKLIIASIPLAAIVVAAGLLWGQDAIKALFIDKDGNVGIGRQSPGAKLDVLGTTRLTNGTGDSAFPWTDGNSYVSGTNVIFRSNGNTPQMILTNTGKLGIRTQSPSYPLDVRGEFRVVNDDTNLQGFTGYWKSSYATIGSYNWKDSKYEPLRVDGSVLSLNSEGGGNVGIGTTDPKAKLDVRGDLIVNGMVNATQTNPMRNGMYPNNPTIWQDIFDAKNNGAISKLGNPSYDDTTYSKTNLWNGRHIIKYGSNQENDGNGAMVQVPADYQTLWVRVLGDRWEVMHVYSLDTNEDLGMWTGGYRDANAYAPDGGVPDSYYRQHQWVPIPVGHGGRVALIAKPKTDQDFWISGIAFSKNPWAHAVQSAVGYHWAVNGGDPTTWKSHEWERDSVSEIPPGTAPQLKVPVIANSHDKLLYLVERDSPDNHAAVTGLTVNGVSIERLRTTYDNPFGRNWNSRVYDRYLAARIPASLIPQNTRFLNVLFDMRYQQPGAAGLQFREIGTHDLEAPF